MQPPLQHLRINLAELKAEIVRKIGPERSKQYFYCLNRLLSLKLSKVEFNNLCLKIVGRGNIPLHNLFVRSILKNACTAKVPPATYDVEVLKPTSAVGNKELPSAGHQQNGSYPAVTQAPNLPALLNGDILPLSPRKARTGIRDRRVGDRCSAIRLNGKTNFASQESSRTHSGNFNVILENGNSTPHDIRRPRQHRQGLMQQTENRSEVLAHHPAKLSVVKRSPDADGPIYVHSEDKNEAFVRENGKELFARSLIQAPFGVPFYPVSVGGACRGLPLTSSSKCVSSFDNGGLLDTMRLRQRMEQIAATQSLAGVSVDCANVLNDGLDAYLKGLIRSCVELVGTRSGHEPTKNSAHKHQGHLKHVNGVIPGHQYRMQSSSRPLEVMQENRPHWPISLLDFRVAMELNPQQLGEDWPLLMERICTRAFEE